MSSSKDFVDFEAFEIPFNNFVCEYELLTISESRLREAIRTETVRAEAAEAARNVSDKTARELRASMAAAAARASEAVEAFTAVQDELTNTKIKLDLVECQRSLFEEKCSELSKHIAVLEKEARELKPLQTSFTELQKQYTELLEKVKLSSEVAQGEATRLENELRRVEKCASAGAELRERARLAAAAHVRERRLASDELRDITRELQIAKGEGTRLKTLVSDLQHKLQDLQAKSARIDVAEQDLLSEAQAEVAAERSTTLRLQKALASALADNAALAAEVHRQDNCAEEATRAAEETVEVTTTNICAIDSFLAEESEK